MNSTMFVYTMLGTICSNYFKNNESSFNEFECKPKPYEELLNSVLRGKNIKIITYDDPPLSYTTEENNTIQGHGVTFELINTLQEKFGFTYEVIRIESRSIGDDKSGILGKLVSGEADMAAAFIPVLPGSNEYVTWGTELGQNLYYVMLKRPSESATGNGLLAPFDIVVWLLILLSLIIVGPIMRGIVIIRCKFCKKSEILSYGKCYWFVYGALMKQGSTLDPTTDATRIMFASWWLFILILTAFYTANLTAFLTLSIFTLPIKNIDDIAKPQNKWFASVGGAIDFSLKNEPSDLELLKTSVVHGYGKFMEISETETLNLVNKGWLYLDDWSTLTRLIFKYYLHEAKNEMEESKRCKYVLAQNSYLLRSLSFAYRNTSNLPDLFNPVIQNFIESGILKYLKSNGLPVSPVCPLNLGNKERRLRNSDLFTTYAVVLVGFIIALLAFMFEHICNNCKKLNTKNEANGNRQKVNLLNTSLKHTFINGREYVVITSNNGKSKYIPIKTPSALLFQYN